MSIVGIGFFIVSSFVDHSSAFAASASPLSPFLSAPSHSRIARFLAYLEVAVRKSRENASADLKNIFHAIYYCNSTSSCPTGLTGKNLLFTVSRGCASKSYTPQIGQQSPGKEVQTMAMAHLCSSCASGSARCVKCGTTYNVTAMARLCSSCASGSARCVKCGTTYNVNSMAMLCSSCASGSARCVKCGTTYGVY